MRIPKASSPSGWFFLPLLALALLCAAAVATRCAAQDRPSPSNLIDDELAPLPSDEEMEEDSWYLDELEGYRRHPIDLLTATPDMLARLPSISQEDAESIISFIDTADPIDLRALDSLPDLTADQLIELATFTRLRPAREPTFDEPLSVRLRARLLTDLQPARGHRDALQRVIPRRDRVTGDSIGLDTIAIGSSYLGTRAGLLNSVAIEWGRFACGLTFEKDPGEPILWPDTLALGYDRYDYVDPALPTSPVRRRLASFVSGHAALRLDPGTLYLGDYTAELGQGLLFGNPFSGTKGSEVTKAPFRSARGLAAYASGGEAHFLRGAALALRDGVWLPKGVDASIFLSYRSLDASLAGDGDSDATVSSLREDGLHRTHGEIRSSGNLTERLIGAHLESRTRSGTIGITGYLARYSAPFSGDLPGEFSGSRVAMASVDVRRRFWWGSIFGEIARSSEGAIGVVGGVSTSVGRTELVAACRLLPAAFSSPHGSGFGESPLRQRNERGFYLGVRARPLERLTISAYIDLYSSPQRTFSLPFPRAGVDSYLSASWAPARGIAILCRLRSERSRDAESVTDELGRERRLVLERIAMSGRAEASYASPGERIRLAARFERSFVDHEAGPPASDGILTFIDLRLRPLRSLFIGARLTLFDTDDYESAIHSFEQDLPGRLTNIPLSGEGRRLTLYIRWRPLPALSLAARYAETVYADRDLIHPGGLDAIDGRVDNDVGVQVDLRF